MPTEAAALEDVAFRSPRFGRAHPTAASDWWVAPGCCPRLFVFGWLKEREMARLIRLLHVWSVCSVSGVGL